MMKKLVSVLAAALIAGTMSVGAAAPGDEVVVVYNKRVAESKALADYYAQRRQVPADQVFGFELPTGDDISRYEFREHLQKPLARLLESRKLWHIGSKVIPATTNQSAHVEWLVANSKIRYAVLCYGVPLRIAEDSSLKEEGVEKFRPEARRNEAAVDSELALLPLIEEKLPLTGWLRNPVYSVTNAALIHPTNGVLMVARLDGPDAAIARGLVDKAILAETNSLWGRTYFDLRNTTEPGLKLGDEWIRNASEICRRLGFETIVDENPGTFPASFPMSQIAFYAGWYDANVSGPFARPTVEFMPGAFAYHLFSFSAASLRTTNQYWVGPLLARGVTATMGCVAEPYLGGSPDIGVFTARFVYSGFSFGEAACAAQLLMSWQTTVIGDPLYRPFGKNPDQLLLELEQHNSPWREWAYLRLLDFNLANGKARPDAGAVVLEQLEMTKKSAVLSEKLADLYAGLGKPNSAADMYSRALTLGPSPQQRIRLRLALGEKLVGLGREKEAYEDYEKLLQESPDYPDKPAIYRHLLPLARKLNKTADADRYEAFLRPPPSANQPTGKK